MLQRERSPDVMLQSSFYFLAPRNLRLTTLLLPVQGLLDMSLIMFACSPTAQTPSLLRTWVASELFFQTGGAARKFAYKLTLNSFETILLIIIERFLIPLIFSVNILNKHFFGFFFIFTFP
jgi:hypothetical protein